MSEIKIKVTQNIKYYEQEEIDPLVLQILNGKRHFGPNTSVLNAICVDILAALHMLSKWSFRYEKNSNGHFFIIDEEILTDPNTHGIFGTESIIYERVSFLS